MKTDEEQTWSEDFAKLIGEMCRQSVRYSKEMKVEGMLVVTLDGGNVVIVNVNKIHNGSNSQFAMPTFTVRKEESRDTVQPLLSKLFDKPQPAQVLVTGLGMSKFVGELVITNSTTAGKMPQAKLILNEQHLALAPSEDTASPRNKTPTNKSRLETENKQKPSTRIPAIHTSIATATLTSQRSGGLNPGTTTSSAPKKSLDSVIAKLHHQTSSSSAGVTTSDKTREEQQKVATSLSAAPQQVELQVSYSRGEETMEVDGAEPDQPKTNRKNAAANNNKTESDDNISKEFVQKLFTTSAVVTTKKPAPDDEAAGDGPTHPPVKRPRTESPRYSQFKESLKPGGKDSAKTSPRDPGKAVEDGKRAASRTPNTAATKESGGDEARGSKNGSASSTPTRESTRIHKKTTPRQSNSTTNTPTSQKSKVTPTIVRNRGRPAKSDSQGDTPQTTSKTNKSAKTGGGESAKLRIRKEREDPSTDSRKMPGRKQATASKQSEGKAGGKKKLKVVSSKASGGSKETMQARAKRIMKDIRTKSQARAAKAKIMAKQKSARQTSKRQKSTKPQVNEQSQKSKRMCMKCEACLNPVADDCGSCLYCLDKKKYGGANTLRQKCVKKQCKVLGVKKKE